jgi:Protein of unknown function (DUF2846)
MRVSRGAVAFALCALLLLGACASVAPPEASAPALQMSSKPQSPQQTRIYVLRDPDIHSELAYPGIKIDDQSVGDLAPAKFLFVDRAPGQHVVAVHLLHTYYPLTLTTRAGAVHYVRLTSRPFVESLLLNSGLLIQVAERAATGHNGGFMLVEMSDAEGRALMQKLLAGGEFRGPAPRD